MTYIAVYVHIIQAKKAIQPKIQVLTNISFRKTKILARKINPAVL